MVLFQKIKGCFICVQVTVDGIQELNIPELKHLSKYALLY